MKYLKEYNDSKEESYTIISNAEWSRFINQLPSNDDKSIDMFFTDTELHNIQKKYKVEISLSEDKIMITFSKHDISNWPIVNMRGFRVCKQVDEYFYVRYSFKKYIEDELNYLFYKCDQLHGLMECIDDCLVKDI